MLPQVISPMPAHLLFVKTVLLVVACGLLHGLFFVPVLLGLLPDHWTSTLPTHNTDNTGCGGEELLTVVKLGSPHSDRYEREDTLLNADEQQRSESPRCRTSTNMVADSRQPANGDTI
jgi:hypothetical protein